MIKRFIVFVSIILLAITFGKVAYHFRPIEKLPPTSTKYIKDGVKELGAENIVTSVVVTYRGLDTLGEVIVLFISATGIGLLLRRRKEDELKKDKREEPSFLVKNVSDILVPLIFMLGIYIFINGHLTPGGGFQGGAVIASGTMLLFLAHPYRKLSHGVLTFLESLSGLSYVIIGLFGLLLLGAGHFLDNRILPLGETGTLLSAGAIPLIYIIIGLKVGTELSVVLEDLREE